jgi:hypothetical protein
VISQLYSCGLLVEPLSNACIVLYEWQSLIAGALALIAAGIGAYFIYRQTNATSNIYEDGVRRRHRSSLLLTSAYVSNITKKINGSIIHSIGLISAEMYKIEEKKHHHAESIINLDLLLNIEELESLSLFCETTDDTKKDRHVTELNNQLSLSDWIIKITHTEYLMKNTINEEQSIDLIISLSIASYLSTSLRKHCEHDPSSNFPLTSISNFKKHWNHIKGELDFSLSQCNAHPNVHTKIINKINAYIATNQSPWIATINK